jgi:hypothetical protein
MPPPVTPTAQIEITRPRIFTAGSVLVVCALGILLGLPLLISVLAVSLMRPGILSLVIPLVVIAGTIYVLPFGLGNAYVARLARKLRPVTAQSQEAFLVQLTLFPRIRSGLLAVIEDADDIGWLTFNASELVFHGDSVKFSIPLGQITRVQRQNIGLRGLYVISRIKVLVPGLPKIDDLEFAERSSWLLPTSKKTTNKLYQQFNSHKTA